MTYTAGANTHDAEYEYDGNARLVNLLDWIDAVDGLEYAYDAAGRVTSMNDYFSPCRLGLIGGFADPGETPSIGRPDGNTSEDGSSVYGRTSQRGKWGQPRLARGLARLVLLLPRLKSPHSPASTCSDSVFPISHIRFLILHFSLPQGGPSVYPC